MSHYLEAKDSAKLIRLALKRAFPAVTFRVRSSTYSLGASVRVSWIDGPTEGQVKDICSRYDGSYFDSEQDMKVRKGEIELTVQEAQAFGRQAGELVTVLNDGTNTDRELSVAYFEQLRPLAAEQARKYGGIEDFDPDQNYFTFEHTDYGHWAGGKGRHLMWYLSQFVEPKREVWAALVDDTE